MSMVASLLPLDQDTATRLHAPGATVAAFLCEGGDGGATIHTDTAWQPSTTPCAAIHALARGLRKISAEAIAATPGTRDWSSERICAFDHRDLGGELGYAAALFEHMREVYRAARARGDAMLFHIN